MMETVRNPEALAVLIAAEGTISLRKNNSKQKWGGGYAPVLAVYNTEPAIVQYAQETVGGKGIIQKREKTKYFANAKPAYTWIMLRQEEVLAVCEEILPYLPTKKRQCELIMEFIRLRQACKSEWYQYNKKRKLPTYGEREGEIVKEIRELNKKGVS